MVSKRKEMQKMKENKESEIEENIIFQKDFVETLRKINRSVLDCELTYFKIWMEEYA